MSLQFKLAASSSYGDFEACVNLLQACFTLVVTNLQKACRLAVQVCCKLKLLSGLLSVQEKPLTPRCRKAKRSQPNRGTRIDPQEPPRKRELSEWSPVAVPALPLLHEK
ncbi:hypothetical protein AVEN_136774-1 [Araneus ventricosus]|uniref:Uncharacterized protein n=1 Tax=Araneus ventricosus TaxID=182803 RepID=A0A4Y1ZNZ9_ARAVE|nr:hypothetical protein AVEN_136774-1 [Araneus ventricosus]